ncbi:MAG TPA: O-antigen ligase family protein [Thermoanaerobaculia bacterium]|nr:O-antigen ligase family protein [Thermoanaerobaculia bacterium]
MIRHAPAPIWALGSVLALLVAWVTMPFGSAEPGAATLVRAVVLAAAAVALAVGARADLLAVRWPAAAALGLAGLGLLQARSWPRAVVESLSPEHQRLDAAAGELLGGGVERVALSLTPDLSRAVALNWLAVAGLLVASAACGGYRAPRRLVAAVLVATALFQILYGSRQLALRSTDIWGRFAPGDHFRLRGTFVNSNHLATYLEIALATLFAAAWWCWRRARREESVERRLLLVGVPLVLWLGLLVALAFTGSRAGLLACLAGTLVQTALLARESGSRRPLLVGAGFVAAGLAAIAFVDLQEGFRRWMTPGSESGLGGRLVADRATFDLWRRFPVTGSGLGSYRESFPMVQPADLGGSWWHAHNDLLEMLATGGVVGLAILLLGLGALVLRLDFALRRGARSEDRAAGLAALGALAVLGVHELFEFGLTLPGNWVPATVVCGMAVAVSVRESRSPDAPRPRRSGPPAGDGSPG